MLPVVMRSHPTQLGSASSSEVRVSGSTGGGCRTALALFSSAHGLAQRERFTACSSLSIPYSRFLFLPSIASTMRDSGSPFVLARRGPHVIFTLNLKPDPAILDSQEGVKNLRYECHRGGEDGGGGLRGMRSEERS